MDQVKPKASRKTKKDLLEMLDKEKEKTQEYLKQLKYLQADFENYRKLTKKQKNLLRELEKEHND